MEKNKTKIKFKIFRRALFSASLLSAFLFGQIAQAASLYPSPSSGSYNIGQSFSVSVYVSSADQAINAVSGVLSFPNDKLEVTSISKSGSVMSLWVQEPSFSNSAGTINFEGIILNPGYTGAAGKVLTVSFRTKGSGSATLTFSSGAILANDGQGTNILSGLGSSVFAVEVPTSGPAAEQGESPVVTAGTLPAPQIKSDTHPDPDAWYNNNTPRFSWDLPPGTDGVRILVGEKPQVNPTIVYVPPISSKSLDSLDDGVWYFHAQLRNSSGWGGVTHFRLQIDTKNPEYFNIEQQAEEDFTSPTRKFYFDATDATSGIGRYEIQIDNGEPLEWTDDGSHLYQTPILGPGRHVAIFKAIDRAGNFLTQTAEFIIDPLEVPIIDDYQEFLTNKDPFLAKGRTYPNSQVVIWLQREATEPKSYIVKSDDSGRFVFLAEEKLRDGIYSLWAEVIDSRGARSEVTEKLTILVEPTKLWKLGNMTIDFLSVVIPLIALIFFLVVAVWRMWFQLRHLKSRIRKEAGEAHQEFHYEINYLKSLVKKNTKLMAKYLAKEKLTKREMLALEKLRKNMETAIEKIDDEIEDVQEQVK